MIGLHLYRSDGFRQFSLYNTSKTIIIKRAREARTFNRKGRFGHSVAKSSLAKNERKRCCIAALRESMFLIYDNNSTRNSNNNHNSNDEQSSDDDIQILGTTNQEETHNSSNEPNEEEDSPELEDVPFEAVMESSDSEGGLGTFQNDTPQ